MTRVRITPPAGAPFEATVDTDVALANLQAEAVHHHGPRVRVEVLDAPPPVGGPVAVILGSRELAATEAARWWAWVEVSGWLAGAERPALVLTTDARGAARVAREVSLGAAVPFESWGYHGTVHLGPQRTRQWHDGPTAETPSRAVERARAMLSDARARATTVRVLVLHAAWDLRNGVDRWAADRARAAGHDVTELTCPPEHGPERAAASARTADTTTASTTTEGTAP